MATLGILVLMVFVGLYSYNSANHALSQLIGSTAPSVGLVRLMSNEKFSPQDKLGKIWLLNVWATWCRGCRAEHQTLLSIKQKQGLDIVGLNYKDGILEARQWLAKLGSPYSDIVMDTEGLTQNLWQISGLPVTYLIDQHGIVRDSRIGPLDDIYVQGKLRPMLERFRAQH